MRLAVAYLFVNIHGAPENEEDWKGPDCIGPKIKNALQLCTTNHIFHIFQDVLACKREGVTYTGARDRDLELLLGRPSTIALNSVEAQIIADSTEDGFGRENTKLQVNKYRKDHNLPLTLSPDSPSLLRTSSRSFRCSLKLPVVITNRSSM